MITLSNCCGIRFAFVTRSPPCLACFGFNLVIECQLLTKLEIATKYDLEAVLMMCGK